LCPLYFNFMKPRSLPLALALFASLAFHAAAGTRYVDLNSPNPTPPYTTWLTAATNIQDAIDAADAGDTVLVTNGVYATGGRVVHGAMTNRVAVTKPLTLQSVNGPEVTLIQGYKRPIGDGFGDSAVRCVYLTNNVLLVGFTLTNGATRADQFGADPTQLNGGGVWCEPEGGAIVSNCVLVANSAFDMGGGAYFATLYNCTLSNNLASCRGGGAYGGGLFNCTISSNRAGGGVCITGNGGGVSSAVLSNCVLYANQAGNGGGAAGSTLENCQLLTNTASGFLCNDGKGGGAVGSVLINCELLGNSATYGGGASGGSLTNCSLIGNTAKPCSTAIGGTGGAGGGTHSSTLNNCRLSGNSAPSGGGAYGGTLNNCTLVDNQASGPGGGAAYGVLNNSIVYFNSAPSHPNHYSASLNYCCTTPLPATGTNNITADPELASLSHLSANSPCRDAGSTDFSSGLDIDGDAWNDPPSIGCDEYHPGTATGMLSVAIKVVHPLVDTEFEAPFVAEIQGHASASRWEFDDGTTVSNRPYATHSWNSTGPRTAIVWAYNDSYPSGVSATALVQVVEQMVHYVSLDSTNPVSPFTSWATAATNIQDAVDANIGSPKTLVLVSNGVYRTGGRSIGIEGMTRLVVSQPITVRSVNGPATTQIDGVSFPGEARCVYLASGAVLSGFTLTNGRVTSYSSSIPPYQRNGAGILCASASAVVSNCVVSGNWAQGAGGGAYRGTFYNCIFTGNFASMGGGAYASALNNCTLTGNSASSGGGVYSGVMRNSIIYGNSAPNGSNYFTSTFSHCCLAPLTNGIGNFAESPLFADFLGGDFRLQSNSPCINAGNNAYVVGDTDLLGNPRIAGGTVDIGAYEFHLPASVLSYAWAQQYGLSTDGSADFADDDGDGANHWQEWRADTIPTNAASALLMGTATNGVTGLVVSWASVATRSYWLERGTDLGGPEPFETIATNIVGVAGTKTFNDTSATNGGPYFYRVGVH
jgi:hypothetical protein